MGVHDFHLNGNMAQPDNSAVLSREDRTIHTMRRWNHFSETAFRVPFTRMRFGWDPILGLVPGLGDVSTGLFALFLLVTAFRLKIPGVIRARLIVNSLLDVFLGAIPFVGDIYDFAWKSNSRNLALLEKHARGEAKPGPSDWIFVLAILAAVCVIIVVPLMVFGALLEKLERNFLGIRLFS